MPGLHFTGIQNDNNYKYKINISHKQIIECGKYAGPTPF